MKKPSIQFISWIAFAITFILSLVYRFGPDFIRQYFEAAGAELLILIPVAIIILVLLKNQRGGNQPYKQGSNPNDRSNQGGGSNPGYNQGRQN